MPKAKSAADEVKKHAERLKYQDEDWKAREEALNKLGALITEGALASEGFVSEFGSNLKDVIDSVVRQLYDLRSVIAKLAVTTLGVLMTEVGDHAEAERPLREEALEGLLQLASSGNKVLSAAGREGFPVLMAHVRFESVVKDGLLVWLRGNKVGAAAGSTASRTAHARASCVPACVPSAAAGPRSAHAIAAIVRCGVFADARGQALLPLVAAAGAADVAARAARWISREHRDGPRRSSGPPIGRDPLPRARLLAHAPRGHAQPTRRCRRSRRPLP
jgi:hypothetical protein